MPVETGGPSSAQAAWIEAHLRPPAGAAPWTRVRLVESEQATATLEVLPGAGGRYTLSGPLHDLLLDLTRREPEPLVLLGGPSKQLLRWGLRRSPSAVLLLPEHAPPAPARARVEVTCPAQARAVEPWLSGLQAGVHVDVVLAPIGVSPHPLQALRQVGQLQRAAERVATALRHEGHTVSLLGASAPLQAASLVVCSPESGWLRRWVAGSLERSLAHEPRAALLVPSAES